MTNKSTKLDRIVETERKLIERHLGDRLSFEEVALLRHYENQRKALYRKFEERRYYNQQMKGGEGK